MDEIHIIHKKYVTVINNKVTHVIKLEAGISGMPYVFQIAVSSGLFGDPGDRSIDLCKSGEDMASLQHTIRSY